MFFCDVYWILIVFTVYLDIFNYLYINNPPFFNGYYISKYIVDFCHQMIAIFCDDTALIINYQKCYVTL